MLALTVLTVLSDPAITFHPQGRMVDPGANVPVSLIILSLSAMLFLPYSSSETFMLYRESDSNPSAERQQPAVGIVSRGCLCARHHRRLFPPR